MSEAKSYNGVIPLQYSCNLSFDLRTKDEKLLIYSQAFNEAADGIQIIDLSGYIMYSNRAVEQIYGFSPDELREKHVNDMNADPDFAELVIIPSIKKNGRWTGEVSVRHKNGNIFPVWLSTSMISNEYGEPIASVRIMRDITQLRQAGKALKEQLLFANSVNQIAEAIISNSDTQSILLNMPRIIGETLGIDRSLIYDIEFDSNVAVGLCEWDNLKTPGIVPTLQNWNLDSFKNVIAHMINEKIGFETHIDDVNPLMIQDGIAELFHKRLGAQSVLYYPFSFRPNGFYLMIFHQVNSIRRWRKVEVDFIDGIAKQVEIAIQKINFLAERQNAQQEIWEQKERAQVTLQSIGDGVITTDVMGNVEYLNNVAEDLTGWKGVEAKGRPLPEVFNVLNENTGELCENPVTRCLREGRIVGLANHTKLVHKDGHGFAIEDSASPIRNRQDEIIGAVLVFHDVSEKRSMLKQMIHQAYHDPLTGLPNRVLFNDRLSLAIAQAHRNNEMLAVLFLDLDRFKQVNDMMGHAKGDILLKDVSEKIAECIRETDTVARLGGDEFTVLLPCVRHAQDAAKVAHKIIEMLDQSWRIDNQEFHITASLGIALYPNDGQDPEALLKHADTAMYRAKDKGKNNYQLYTQAMNTKIMERIKMESDLRQALKREEFRVFYQPQVNSGTGQITGVEALVRWCHPERGLMLPAEFIPLAEETGLIVPMGEWVLRTACAKNKRWQDEGLQPARVTVNISACQFEQQNLVGTIQKILEMTGLEAKWLELEITESALMKDVDSAIRTLNELKTMGVRISIDDFGTGYSSLNYLKRFPIHTLKIDRSFVKDIISNPEDVAIVSTVIAMAQNLNLQVIAEGVETEEQLAFLEQRKCIEMQGFLFSKPLPTEEIEVLLRRNTLRPSEYEAEAH